MAPASMKNQQQQQRQQKRNNNDDNTCDNDDGIWIGLDLGTSNSACAVWDSNRGGPKWMRLPGGVAAAASEDSHKTGRIMPSVVRWLESPSSSSQQVEPLVGQQALDVDDADNDTDNTNAQATMRRSSSSLFQSVKRLLGKRYSDLDSRWIESLDFEVKPIIHSHSHNEEEEGLQLTGRTSLPQHPVTTTPQDVLAVELEALRMAAQSYLDHYRAKKNLRVPGGDSNNNKIRHVVVGVPAHYSQRHLQYVKEACRQAGFDGHIGTCLESTAAAMAYGLTLQETSHRQVIMVVDMGGGTTDITIASKSAVAIEHDHEDHHHRNDSSYQVLLTQGDDRLGGDDIDQAIMEYCMQETASIVDCESVDQQHLRWQCRRAKEALCRQEGPSSSESILVGTRSQKSTKESKIVLTQDIIESILEPWLQRAKDLMLHAVQKLPESSTQVNEVVLVGGTTRIAAVRRMIRNVVPEVELSTSLNPMSSVCQGLAIQAALSSRKVPLHELKSAMMLDCVPHAIGVQLSHGDEFVELIPRNTRLPANGSATFVLANREQPGVTIRAVEQVAYDTYEPMSREDFTFLLRRLTPHELKGLSVRNIQVGMKVDTDGKFIVSIFDELDAEQVRKRERYEAIVKGNEDVVGELGYIKDLVMAESGTTTEQFLLLGTLVGLIVLYIAVRVAFTDPFEGGGTIL